MLVVALNGSPHQNGNTTFLLKELGKHIENLGAEFQVISVAEAMDDVKDPFCRGCQKGYGCDEHCYKGTKLEKAFDLMTKADEIVLASPVQYGSMSGLMKCFFDKTLKIRIDRKWVGKIGAAISVAGARNGGQETALRALHELMLVHGIAIVSDCSLASGCGHYGVTAQAPAEEDAKQLERLRILAEGLVDLAKRK